MQNWEILISGQRYEGPPDLIRDWVREGRVLANDQVRVPGRDWAAAEMVPELKDVFHRANAIPKPPAPLPTPPRTAPATVGQPLPATGRTLPPAGSPPPFANPPALPSQITPKKPFPWLVAGIVGILLLAGGYFALPYLGISLSGSYDHQMVGYAFKRQKGVAYTQVTLPSGFNIRTESVNPYRIDPNYWVEGYNDQEKIGFLLSSRDFPPEDAAQRNFLKTMPMTELAELLYKETRGKATQLKDISTDEVFGVDKLTVGGREALRQTISGKNGMTMFRMYHTIIRGEHGLHIICLWSPDDRFDANQSRFTEILDSFREATDQSFKFSHRIAEEGDGGSEFIFLSDNPISVERDGAITPDGDNRSRLAAGTGATATVNGRKFRLKNTGATQGRNNWPTGEAVNRKVIIRLDSVSD